MLSKFFKKTRLKIISAALIALGFFGALYLGFYAGVHYPQNLVIKGVANIENDPTVIADFGVFWQAWKLIKDEYLRSASSTDKKLVYGAIDGLVNSLGDPNTVFFPPEDSKKFEEDVTGNFGGIGAEIGIRNDQLVVVAPLKGSPAEKAGIRSGDKILKIDDKITIDLKVNDAVKLIRGPVGTRVTLLILRNGWDKPKDITIVRQVIQIPTLDYKMLYGNIGYIRIRAFNENAPDLFYAASKDLLSKGLNGMIVDLRDDPGGFLEVAVNISGWFVEKGSTVAIQEFRSPADRKVFPAYGNGIYHRIPIVVLINQGSASASEILAGALRDDLNAKLVGEKSFGKGTVQELKRLKDGSSIKLTIAHWLTPKGTLIDKNGLNPDYEVKLTEDDAKAGKDPQLDEAQKIMKELVKKLFAA